MSLTLQSALSVCYPSVTHSSWQFSAHSEESWRRQERKTSFHSGETPWICRIYFTRKESFKNINPGHLRVWKVIVGDDVIQNFSSSLILNQLSSHAMNYNPGWHDMTQQNTFPSIGTSTYLSPSARIASWPMYGESLDDGGCCWADCEDPESIWKSFNWDLSSSK